MKRDAHIGLGHTTQILLKDAVSPGSMASVDDKQLLKSHSLFHGFSLFSIASYSSCYVLFIMAALSRALPLAVINFHPRIQISFMSSQGCPASHGCIFNHFFLKKLAFRCCNISIFWIHLQDKNDNISWYQIVW